jgi:hypothetical protein
MSAGLTIGDLFRHQMGANTTVHQTLDIYPELSHLAQYQLALDVSLATKIKTWLGWQSTVSDRYISDPSRHHQQRFHFFHRLQPHLHSLSYNRPAITRNAISDQGQQAICSILCRDFGEVA